MLALTKGKVGGIVNKSLAVCESEAARYLLEFETTTYQLIRTFAHIRQRWAASEAMLPSGSPFEGMNLAIFF